jgi:tetratricopeptide (TPR) repeat protein
MPGLPNKKQGRPKGVEVRPEAVRQARLEAGLSLAQVAEGEVTRAAIHLVETGRMRPSMRTLQLIARKTQQPISYFLPEGEASETQRASRDELERRTLTEDFAGVRELGERLLGLDLPPGVDADVRFFLGVAYARLHDGQRALDQLNKARTFYEDIGDAAMAVEAIDYEAIALMLLDDPRARSRALEALQRSERMRPPRRDLQVRVLLHLGAVSHRDGDWRGAARFLERGLELSKEVPHVRHIAVMHDGLSAAYSELGNFSGAIREAKQAFKLYTMDRDVRSLMRIENNLGYLLLRQGDIDAAERHLNRALEICDEHGLERFSRAHVLSSLGELHMARAELEQAGARLEEALAIANAQGERRTQATVRRLLGRLHLRRGDHDAADQMFTEAIELFARLEMPERLRECLMEYAEALQQRGLLQESIGYWRQAAEAGRQTAVSSAESAAILDETGA